MNEPEPVQLRKGSVESDGARGASDSEPDGGDWLISFAALVLLLATVIIYLLGLWLIAKAFLYLFS